MLDCIINGKRDHRIPVTDRGLSYGDGLFETLVYRGGQLTRFDEHYRRLQTGAQVLQLDLPRANDWLADIQQLDKPDTCVIKLILTRGSGGRGYAIPAHTEVTRICLSYAMPERSFDTGLHLKLCRTPVSENTVLAGIKHLNRLENVLARSELGDYDEGIMLDGQGHVIECTQSNLFAVKDRYLITPALTVSGIKGIVRQWILDQAQLAGIPCRETTLTPASLRSMDELWVCNSVMGIQAVSRLEQQDYVHKDMYQHFHDLYQRQLLTS